MTKPLIDTIIFDLGGVLIDWNPAYLYRKIFEEPSQADHFLREICTPDWNAQQDAGRPLAEATEQLVAEHPDFESPIRAYYDRWTEMLGGPIEGTVRLLEQIHHNSPHRLYALTNWSHETFPLAQDRFDFLQLFRGIVVSGREKMKKPDPRIYHLMFQRYDINPAEALFIDDSTANVATARQLGLKTIHFKSAEQLQAELMAQGVRLGSE